MYPLATACGNTMIMKPSERVRLLCPTGKLDESISVLGNDMNDPHHCRCAGSDDLYAPRGTVCGSRMSPGSALYSHIAKHMSATTCMWIAYTR